MKDPYIVLGVPREADADLIKAAYHALLKMYHPDRAGNDPADIEKFLEIRAAWEFLSDAHRRRPVGNYYRNKTGHAEASKHSTPRPETSRARSAFGPRANEGIGIAPQSDIRASTSPALIDRIRFGVETLVIYSLGGIVALLALVLFG
jgi:curved DNA-binding protein CbpA